MFQTRWLLDELSGVMVEISVPSRYSGPSDAYPLRYSVGVIFASFLNDFVK